MKTLATILLLLVVASSVNANEPDQIRTHFVRATQDLEARSDLVADLRAESDLDEAFSTAYLGAALTLLAECGMVPWTKYNRFTSGTQLLEQSILQSPDVAEFKYLRFIIQLNAPLFLGYDANLKNDYLAVKEAISETTEPALWMLHFQAFEGQNELLIRKRISATQ
ncbi:MAG: hypothetical protein RLP15_09340 [Cryomorphaceae bacterium]